MNIILVVIDTLRYDYIGANGNRWIETPNLDRFAAESWSFDAAFAASFPTIPHRTDLITGRYGDPFHIWTPLPFNAVTLPRLLAEKGYCTQLIHDTPHLVNGGHAFDYPFHAWTMIRGAEVDRPWIDDRRADFPDNWKADTLFDFAGHPQLMGTKSPTSFTYPRANRNRRRYEDWNCARLFNTAAQWLRDNSRRNNFFLWLDSFDPHEPWDSPPEYVLKYDRTPGYDGTIDPRGFLVKGTAGSPDAAVRRIAAWYAAKVTWVDHWFGRLLETLDETHLTGNTAVVATADHGTNVGERGHFGKRFPVWEQESHVPLMIRPPGLGSGRSDVIAQPQDIFATILGIGGATAPPDTQGCDLLAQLRGAQPPAREVALAGRHVQAWAADQAQPLFTVFDRQWFLEYTLKPEDSRLMRYGSQGDVASEHPKVVERLRQQGLAEIERRGLAGPLVTWLRERGRKALPEDCCVSPLPAGYRHYWDQLYNKW